MADANFDKVFKTLEDPLYVAVGFGVLAFQRAQVWRHDLQRRLGGVAGAAGNVVGATRDVASAANHFAGAASDLAGAASHIVGARRQAAGRVNRPVDPAQSLPGHIPDEAKEFVRAAVDLAGDVPKEAAELVKEALAVGRFALKVLQGPMARRTNP
jgi:hypothetical protein